jgi:hypothetical protein
MEFGFIFSVLIGTLFAQDSGSITHEGNNWTDTERAVATTPATQIVKISARGHLTVRGTNSDQVTYKLTKHVRARSMEEARAAFGFMGIKNSVVNGVTTIGFEPSTRPNVVTELVVEVPRRLTAVILDVRMGDVEAYDLDGGLRAETVAGQIRCDNIRGSFDGRTGGGEMHLGKIGGAIHCSNRAGSIIIDNAGSSANCQTAGGEIQVHEAMGALVLATEGGNIQVDHAGSNVDAHTGEGVIEIGQCNGTVFADTRGGSIQIGSARGVRCSTSAGQVRVKTSSGPMQIQTTLGSILAELLSGSRLQDSSLMAGTGDVTVLIPSNIALSVLARNDSGANPRIVSDFSELRARSILAQPAMVYQGTINGGGPLLTLNTASGTIYVKKSK